MSSTARPSPVRSTDALGCKGGWMGYFGMRAAPLGAASADTVTSAFYNFHPSLVGRAIPDAWRVATPEAFLPHGWPRPTRRWPRSSAGTSATDRRSPRPPNWPCGRPPPHPPRAGRWAWPTPCCPRRTTRTWRCGRRRPHCASPAATVTSRALIAAGLDPCETLVAFAAEHGIDPAFLQTARRWSAEDWQAAADRLTGRGLLADGKLTEQGAAVRAWVEQRTDQAAAAPWQTIGEAATERLAQLMTPISLRIAQANDAIRVNPMALDAVRELGG